MPRSKNETQKGELRTPKKAVVGFRAPEDNAPMDDIVTTAELLSRAEEQRTRREFTFMSFFAQALGQEAIESGESSSDVHGVRTWESALCDGLLIKLPKDCHLSGEERRDPTKLFHWASTYGQALQYLTFDFKVAVAFDKSDAWELEGRDYSFTIRYDMEASPGVFYLIPYPLKRFVRAANWAPFGVEAKDLRLALDRIMALACENKTYVNPTTGVVFDGWQLPLRHDSAAERLLPKADRTKLTVTSTILEMWEDIEKELSQEGEAARFVVNPLAPLICDYIFRFDERNALIEDKRECSVEYVGGKETPELKISKMTTHGGYILKDFAHFLFVGVNKQKTVHVISRADLRETGGKTVTASRWHEYTSGKGEAKLLLEFIRKAYPAAAACLRELKASLELLPSVDAVEDGEELLADLVGWSRARPSWHYGLWKQQTEWLLLRLRDQFAEAGSMLCFEVEMPFCPGKARRSFTHILIVDHEWTPREVERYRRTREQPFLTVASSSLRGCSCLCVRYFRTEPDNEPATRHIRDPMAIYKLDTRAPEHSGASWVLLASPLLSEEERQTTTGIEHSVPWMLAPSSYFKPTARWQTFNFGLDERREKGDGVSLMVDDGIDLQRHMLRFEQLTSQFRMLLDPTSDEGRVATGQGFRENPKFSTRNMKRTVQEVLQELWNERAFLGDELGYDEGEDADGAGDDVADLDEEGGLEGEGEDDG